MLEMLEEGREAYARRAWDEAYQALVAADQSAPLEAGDLELLATSAYMTLREYHSLLERVHHAHANSGSTERAARSAAWLGLMLFLRGDVGQANGWLARARRLIEGLDCAVEGYLLLPESEQHLAEGDGESAHDSAVAAADIGVLFGDGDLVALARHLQGRALIQMGRISSGLPLLDEAMLAAVSGELSPIVTGLVYCSVIEACQQVFALSRAREWTAALNRWCEQQPELVAFTGTCLVHRAEILQFHGAWPDAMAEACHACERSAGGSKARPPAAALYRRAEIHRLRGEMAEAEHTYREAARRGCEPQPGLALLRLSQGRARAAQTAIRRVLAGASDPLQRARLLPAQVEIALALSNFDEAREGCRELEEIARRFDADVLHAMAAHARGATDLGEDHAAASLIPLRRAFELWQQVEAPYEAARTRVLIGAACRALGDVEAGNFEIEAAREVFERLGAATDLAQLHPTDHAQILTSRELQVLRLVASGKTNRAIASELFLSERTIDRHVSNILTKLDVPSRAAATAYAYDHGIL